ncbi:S8 family serine peptidase [Actinophytocola sp.]|uniref:S8 family serine peptidase n=1 Tax=Actinophytocola sp. TaxID=1872138 RepID=UPI002ED2C6BF
MRITRFALVTVAAAVLALPPAPVTAQPGAAGATGDPAAPLGTVTLITGDRVTVRGDRVVAVSMHASRRAVRYWQQSQDGHDFVIPMDAARALAEGRLDKRLFDVTGLVQQGYDDQHTREVPVIVEAPKGARAVAPAAARLTQDLGDVGMLGLTVSKTRAVDFFRSSPGTKIWLDAKVQSSLDQSVPRTGAPKAWQAGYRADGVKVAVLDTGADATHPDLAGKIDAVANFSPDPDTNDGNGHGTHVASTILGSGAASGSRLQGMAPGARLLVGKVLSKQGYGSESGIIAGMRWAAEQGARVVNMSLGGGWSSDGTDPMSLALNDISQSTGALFVVAAGNLGRNRAVTSPAAADKALAVASVTKSGQLSGFSSRGPRAGDNGLKPEIAAPGSDIVAARAAGTLAEQSVNAHYAKLSGTSMASPHVAGAAAIVAGQHPDWRADQIKAALVDSAKPIDGVNQFGQGAGVVDVARAVTQQTRVEPAAITFNTIQGNETGAVYVNDVDRPVELTVSADLRHLDGSAAPAGLFSLSSTTLTVPAKGTAKLSLKVSAEAGQSGLFVGAITAKGGSTKLTTPVSVTLAGEEHTLTVRATDRHGNPGVSNIAVQNETTGEVYSRIVADGVFSPTVPAGRYRVIGQILEGGWNVDGVTTFALPGTEVDEDTELTVSAAGGKPVTVSVDEPTARPDPSAGGHGVVSIIDGQTGRRGAGVLFSSGPVMPMYAIGSPEIPGLFFGHISKWQQPWTTITVTGPNGYSLTDLYEQSREGWRGSVTGRLVDVGDASTDPGDLHGRVPMLATTEYVPDEEMVDRVRMLKERGAQVVVAYNYIADLSILPVVQLFDSRAIARFRADLANGPVEVRVDGRRDSAFAFFNAEVVPGHVPNGYEFRFEKAKMGRVDSRFASLKTTDDRSVHIMTAQSDVLNAGFEVNTRTPQQRTDYYSPAFTWQTTTSLGFDPTAFTDHGWELTSPINMKAGERTAMCMYCAPFGPELARSQPDAQTGEPRPWAYRQGEKLTFEVPMFGGNDPSTFTFMDATNKGTTVLSRGGKEIGRNDAPGRGEFDIPRGAGRYTLVSDATKTLADWPLSTRTRAEWTFLTTPSGERTALPLLDIQYDLPLDVNNAAPATGISGFVTAVHQDGAARRPIRQLTVDVSFDDGASWQPVKVAAAGSRWKLDLPAGTGFASLRTTAVDTAGNSVTETIIRAYRVR